MYILRLTGDDDGGWWWVMVVVGGLLRRGDVIRIGVIWSWQGNRWIDGVDDDNQVNQIRKSSSYEGEDAS